MKKLSIVLLSAIALAACSKDVVKDSYESAIDFDLAANGTVLKTVAPTASTLKEFNVWSYTQATEAADRKAVMEGITVKNTEAGWTYSPKKYWPNEKVLDFYAIAGTDNVTVSAGSAVVDFAETTTTDQFGEAFDCKNNPSIVYATAMDMTKETLAGRVTMNFRHAMSQLQFKVKNVSTVESEVSYAPVYFTIEGLDSKGTYTLPMAASTTADFDEATSHGTWTTGVVEGKENVPHRVVVSTEKVGPTETKLITDADDIHMVLPQKKDIKFVVSVNVYQGEFFICNCIKKISTSVDWKEGYRYTYTLRANESTDPTLQEYTIDFDVTVDEFKIAEEYKPTEKE